MPEGEDPDTLINRESSKAFSKRIEGAQTLSSFLIDHIKGEVPFDTIEGKTLFLEKSATLINMVNYSIYRQQLIEGDCEYDWPKYYSSRKSCGAKQNSKCPVFQYLSS